MSPLSASKSCESTRLPHRNLSYLVAHNSFDIPARYWSCPGSLRRPVSGKNVTDSHTDLSGSVKLRQFQCSAARIYETKNVFIISRFRKEFIAYALQLSLITIESFAKQIQEGANKLTCFTLVAQKWWTALRGTAYPMHLGANIKNEVSSFGSTVIFPWESVSAAFCKGHFQKVFELVMQLSD